MKSESNGVQIVAVVMGGSVNPSYTRLKREGYNVHIIDHLPRSGLLEKYSGCDVDVSRIEEVDFVWRAGVPYSELTGREKHYDWIIASHVIEHVPDLIVFLNECDAILKDDGVLSLAIPDKRYCFDHFRPISGIGNVIDNHIRRVSRPSPVIVAEHMLYEVSRAGDLSWNAECGMPGCVQLALFCRSCQTEHAVAVGK